jgi:hypothetical protein
MKNEWGLVGASALLSAVCLTAAYGGAPRDETQPAAGLDGPAAPGVPKSDATTQTTREPVDQPTGGVQPPPPGSGAISGRIRLTGPAPGNPVIRMGADPLCSRLNRGTRVVYEVVHATSGPNLFIGRESFLHPFLHVEHCVPVVRQRFIPRNHGADRTRPIRRLGPESRTGSLDVSTQATGSAFQNGGHHGTGRHIRRKSDIRTRT